MTDHHGTTPQTKHLVTTQEDAFHSPQHDKRGKNTEHVKPATFDNLLTLNESFYRTESRLLAIIAARMRVPASDIEDVVQEV